MGDDAATGTASDERLCAASSSCLFRRVGEAGHCMIVERRLERRC
jgi:hypothetical protein